MAPAAVFKAPGNPEMVGQLKGTSENNAINVHSFRENAIPYVAHWVADSLYSDKGCVILCDGDEHSGNGTFYVVRSQIKKCTQLEATQTAAYTRYVDWNNWDQVLSREKGLRDFWSTYGSRVYNIELQRSALPIVQDKHQCIERMRRMRAGSNEQTAPLLPDTGRFVTVGCMCVDIHGIMRARATAKDGDETAKQPWFELYIAAGSDVSLQTMGLLLCKALVVCSSHFNFKEKNKTVMADSSQSTPTIFTQTADEGTFVYTIYRETTSTGHVVKALVKVEHKTNASKHANFVDAWGRMGSMLYTDLKEQLKEVPGARAMATTGVDVCSGCGLQVLPFDASFNG